MKRHRQQITSEDCSRVHGIAGQSLGGLSGTTILISGGSGFMGCWLLEMIAFLNQRYGMGIAAIVMSRDTGRLANALPHIAGSPWLTCIRSDVRAISDLPRSITHIIHAAGDPDSRNHASRPLETLRAIGEGAASIIHAAQRLGDLRLILNISSGNIAHVGTLQAADLAKTVSGPYVEAKRFAEALFQAARSELRLPVVQVRPYSFLGPYQREDSPLATNGFLRDAMNGRPIRILGDGQSVRTVMYGADLAMWLLVMAEKGRDGSVYNIGAEQGHTIMAIAQAVADQFHPRPQILLNSALASQPARTTYIPDLSSVHRALGVRTYTDLAVAVAHTKEWMDGDA